MKEEIAGYGRILRECADIADQRQSQYGDVINNFREVQEICAAMFGMKLTLVQVAQLMVALKWSRERHKHNDDNLLDAVNYTAILLHIIQSEKAL